MKCLLLILALMPAVAYGRIGDTLEECIERYGKPGNEAYSDSSDVGTKTYVFNKNGLRIEVSIWREKVFRVLYRFWSYNREVTTLAFKKLLKSNGGEKEWGEFRKWGEVSVAPMGSEEVGSFREMISASTEDDSIGAVARLNELGNLHYAFFYSKRQSDEVDKLLEELRAKWEEERAKKVTDGL